MYVHTFLTAWNSVFFIIIIFITRFIRIFLVIDINCPSTDNIDFNQFANHELRHIYLIKE